MFENQFMLYINRIKDKTTWTAVQAYHILMILSIKQTKNENYLNIKNAICEKPTPDITFSSEKLKTFPLRSRAKKVPTLFTFFLGCTGD